MAPVTSTGTGGERRSMSTTTLASLALLKANIESEGRDVLDMVAPLVEFAGCKSGLAARFSPVALK